MDTHIATDPAIDEAPQLRARLPGEPDPGHGETLSDPPLRAGARTAPPPSPAPRRRRRVGLLSSVAVLGIVVLAGGGFLLSPYNTVVPVPANVRLAALHAETRIALLWHRMVSGGPERDAARQVRTAAVAPAAPPALPAPPPQAPPHVLAPAAALAGVHAPAPPSHVVQPPYKPQPKDQELKEVMKLRQSPTPASPSPSVTHPGKPESGSASPAVVGHGSHQPATQITAGHSVRAGGAAKPTAPPDAQAGYKTMAPPAKAVPPEAQQPPAVHLALAKAAPPPVHQTPAFHLAFVTSTNALDVAHDLRAAPMSSSQQVQVLELVTQLATLIRDERTEIANLRVDVRKSDGASAAKIADFERRLALVEAKEAMAAAAGTSSPAQAVAEHLRSAKAATPSDVPVALLSAKAALGRARRAPAHRSATAKASSVSPQQYRVQAASPGLAMLAEIGRGGGPGAQLEVQVGDSIPGYGRVLSVAQQGTNWVVKTEHGTIR